MPDIRDLAAIGGETDVRPDFRDFALCCTGGKMEKETEASGYFEVDDAKCKEGQYDFKLDKDFNVTVITRD